MRGIIYIMETAVLGVIKIGISEKKGFKERMRGLIRNGYYNITGLKKSFAIEVDNYKYKEKLLKEIFSKNQVGDSELFSIDVNLVRELLLSFDGDIIYPEEDKNKEKLLKEIYEVYEENNKFSFHRIGLGLRDDGGNDFISYVGNPEITAEVVGEKKVKYDGEEYSLSGLTRYINELNNTVNKSGSYQGARYWKYNGETLINIFKRKSKPKQKKSKPKPKKPNKK